MMSVIFKHITVHALKFDSQRSGQTHAGKEWLILDWFWMMTSRDVPVWLLTKSISALSEAFRQEKEVDWKTTWVTVNAND